MKDWKSNYSKYKEFFLNSYGEYTKKEEVKMFLELVLSLFASAFFIFFALQPTVLTIGELLKTIKAKEEVIIKMDEKIKNLEIAKSLYVREASRIELVNFAVPDSPFPDIFSQQIQGLSGLTQTSVTNISVDQVSILGNEQIIPHEDLGALPEAASGMPFTINASSVGGSFSLTTFLSEIIKLRRAIKIDKVALSSTFNEGAQNIILSLVGRGAYIGQEEPPKSDAPAEQTEEVVQP